VRRYLFGPVTPAFADQHLHRARHGGHYLAIDPAGATDLAVGPSDTWPTVCQRPPWLVRRNVQRNRLPSRPAPRKIMIDGEWGGWIY
jgi:hypothetical protein